MMINLDLNVHVYGVGVRGVRCNHSTVNFKKKKTRRTERKKKNSRLKNLILIELINAPLIKTIIIIISIEMDDFNTKFGITV